MSLADYLAKNYLTADNSNKHKSSKKRKRKETGNQSGLTIAEDDAGGWNNIDADDDQDVRPTIVSGGSAEFRKAKKSNWTSVGTPTPRDVDEAAADAILASAAAENSARTAAEDADDAPQVVGQADTNESMEDAGEDKDDDDDDDNSSTYMESGAKAGLQTADQVTAALERRKRAEQKRFREDDPATTGKGQDTIYRDATGRVINVAMKRAEARKAAEDEAKKKAAEQEALKGDVQRREKQQRKQQLQDAKYLNVARYADDAEMNEDLKDRERWNDPAAQFLAKKKASTSKSGRPLYQGSAAPNRYGIRPGYRWDGVDRSNGFEKQYFAAQNKRQNARDLSYAWEMDE